MNAQPDIPAFLDRRPFVGTFTILSSYKNCPHQMFRRYIVKDQPYIETPEMKFGNDVHTAFERRIGSRTPLPDTMRQWECFATPFDAHIAQVEQKLGITAEGRATGFFDNNVWFRGKNDVTLINGTTAYLLDFKTGKSGYEDPFELATNAMLLHAKKPELTKIVGSYCWLKENRMGQLYDVSSTLETWNEVCRLMGEILAKRAQDAAAFEKIKSGLCGWCSVSDCENWFERRK